MALPVRSEYQFVGQAQEHEISANDGLQRGQNYEVLEEVGQGKTTTVYAAVCKRGRLRNRKVALKKITKCSLSSNIAFSQLDSISSLHYTLHHPAIVSLLSTFSTPSAHYQVLELCAHGSLLTFLHSRSPQTLSENEVRGVLRTLVDALIYLKKELVVHNNIKPENVLLTHDFRIKLTDFKFAKRIRAENSEAKSISTFVNHGSTENERFPASSFAADLWALGCLVVTCLSGLAMCEQPEPMSQGSDAAFDTAQDMPKTTSYEARDLIYSLLQVSPQHRTPLHRIVSHPFFNPVHPTEPLRPSSPVETPIQGTTEQNIMRRKSELNKSAIKSLTIPPKDAPKRSHDASLFRSKRKTLGEIKNIDLRHLLPDEDSSNIGLPALPTRRIVSDPLPRKGSLASELAALTSGTASTTSQTPAEEIHPFPLLRGLRISGDSELRNTRPNLFSPNHPPTSLDKKVVSGETTKERRLLPFQDIAPCNATSQPKDLQTISLVSVGTTRPIPFSTVVLPPRNHKTVYGQVTVLPSRSLLVDFRESERKRGKKGDEVFVIDPTGVEVKVYHAPHLSSPCCLVEPSHIFPTELLPSKYWKQHNDAGHLVEQIKQRTSKMIIYNANAKCVLMANAPQADIELLFPLSSANRKPSNFDSPVPSMRIRLSRRQQSVEIAGHLSRGSGGLEREWTKTVLRFDQDQEWGVREDEVKVMESVAKEGLKEMMRFLEICQSVEKIESEEPRIQSGGPCPPRPQATQTLSFPSTGATIRKALPTEHPPVPSNHQFPPTPSSTNQEPSSQRQTAFSLEHLASLNHVQARFLPSIGWCIRYPSLISQGGRYRIMFLDGVALEIDADEEWVICKGEGRESRHRVGELVGKGVGERMKVFEKFIGMFEDME